jgi:hypothetical protein
MDAIHYIYVKFVDVKHKNDDVTYISQLQIVCNAKQRICGSDNMYRINKKLVCSTLNRPKLLRCNKHVTYNQRLEQCNKEEKERKEMHGKEMRRKEKRMCHGGVNFEKKRHVARKIVFCDMSQTHNFFVDAIKVERDRESKER